VCDLSASCPRFPSLCRRLLGSCLLCLLVGASVADPAVPAGERVLAAGLVHSCLRPLSLPPWSRVARLCPPSFRPFGGAEAEAPLGQGVVPDLLFFHHITHDWSVSSLGTLGHTLSLSTRLFSSLAATSSTVRTCALAPLASTPHLPATTRFCARYDRGSDIEHAMSCSRLSGSRARASSINGRWRTSAAMCVPAAIHVLSPVTLP
jgi:hypothetical protein